jgi:hypothetical protein
MFLTRIKLLMYVFCMIDVDVDVHLDTDVFVSESKRIISPQVGVSRLLLIFRYVGRTSLVCENVKLLKQNSTHAPLNSIRQPQFKPPTDMGDDGSLDVYSHAVPPHILDLIVLTCMAKIENEKRISRNGYMATGIF